MSPLERLDDKRLPDAAAPDDEGVALPALHLGVILASLSMENGRQPKTDDVDPDQSKALQTQGFR